MALSFTISPTTPQLGQTITISWRHTNHRSKGYNFQLWLIVIRPNGTTESKKIAEYWLDSGATKTGTYAYTIPQDLPGKYTITLLTKLYAYGKWADDDKVSTSFIIPGTEEPTVYDFVNALIQYYGSKTPTIDVSKILENKLPEDPEHSPPKEYLDYLDEAEGGFLGVDTRYFDDRYGCCAKLTLHLERPEEIKVEEYGYDMPPKRYRWAGDFAKNVVRGWLLGYEKVRMYSKKSGKWYWVTIPCDFQYKFKDAEPILNVYSDGTVEFGYRGRYMQKDTLLFVDGQLVDRIEYPLDKWKEERPPEVKKRTKLPPLPKGFHTLTVVYCYCYVDRYGNINRLYGTGAASKSVYVAGTGICTKEQFRNGMVNNFKNSPQTVGWVNQYSPIVDVTQLVKQVYPDAQKAFLVIYGDDLSKIRVQGGYTSQPSPLPYSQIVYNWRVPGEEWERQYCSADGKYYWVIYPCKVFIFRKFDITPSKTTLSPGESFSVNGTVEHITTQGKSVSFEFGVTPSWDPVLRKTTKTVTGTGSWQTTTLSASLLAPTSGGSYSISAYLKVGL